MTVWRVSRRYSQPSLCIVAYECNLLQELSRHTLKPKRQQWIISCRSRGTSLRQRSLANGDKFLSSRTFRTDYVARRSFLEASDLGLSFDFCILGLVIYLFDYIIYLKTRL